MIESPASGRAEEGEGFGMEGMHVSLIAGWTTVSVWRAGSGRGETLERAPRHTAGWRASNWVTFKPRFLSTLKFQSARF